MRKLCLNSAIFLVLLAPGFACADGVPDPDLGLLGRFHFDEAEAVTRFNYMDRQGEGVTDRGLQYRIRTRGRLDLTGDGSTSIDVRAETGKGFDNSWNNTGAGLGSGQWIFNVKSIALHHSLGSHVKLEAGGLDFAYGAGTNQIYASDDGHMTGYRAALEHGAAWLPDSVSVTAAYVGNFENPNVFSRFRMDRVNYLQVLTAQKLGKGVEGSAEFDSLRRESYAREALRSSKLWIFDDPGVEVITRITGRIDFAWSSNLSRRWGQGRHFHTDLIYSDLPSGFYLVRGERVLLNRGEMDLGKRLSGGAGYRISQNAEIAVFAGRLLDHAPSKRWVAQVGVNYQFAKLMNRLLR